MGNFDVLFQEGTIIDHWSDAACLLYFYIPPLHTGSQSGSLSGGLQRGICSTLCPDAPPDAPPIPLRALEYDPNHSLQVPDSLDSVQPESADQPYMRKHLWTYLSTNRRSRSIRETQPSTPRVNELSRDLTVPHLLWEHNQVR